MSEELGNYLVKKSNELVKASYAMTVGEQRLLLACMCHINSIKKMEENQIFTISVGQIQELFYEGKAGKDNAYRDLRDAAEKLFDREVRIARPNDRELLTRFVQSVEFDPNQSQVHVRFATELVPYLSQLHQQFTEYRIKHITQLTSTYAIRIYELLVSWFGRDGTFTQNRIEIDELRKILDITDKYKQIVELKSKVIMPAIQQINENTDFTVSVEFTKQKRAFKWITFTFHRKAEIQAQEQAARAQRQEQAEHNRIAQFKREYAEQKAAERQAAKEMAAAQLAQEQAEQQQQLQQEQAKAEQIQHAIQLWQRLDDEQHQAIYRIIKSHLPVALHTSLNSCFKEKNIDLICKKFGKEFLNAIASFDDQTMAEEIIEHTEKTIDYDDTERLEDHFRQPETTTPKPNEQPNDDKRAKYLKLLKNGIISEEEFTMLIS